ncbi:hypothetical protein NMY22_g15338 [Coprinellus aureogranulatus]|nr:hypothetical protein NMY22_g15338 [Coprinellus aureogranulatus]
MGRIPVCSGNAHDSEHYRLGGPRTVFPPIPQGLERKLASALATRYTPINRATIPLKTVRKYFKTKNVETYGRIVCLNDGDVIRAAAAVKTVGQDGREASFVKYMLYVDRNAHLTYEEADEDLQLKSYFGEVQRVFLIRMPKSTELHIKSPETVVLVEIQPCDMDAGLGKLKDLPIYLYPGMKDGTEIVDLTAVRCLVRRFKWKDTWALIDRSGGAECMASD